LADQLPAALQDSWRRARSTRIAPLVRRGVPTFRGRKPKPQTPIGLWAPATAVMLLSHTLRMVAAAEELEPPLADFDQILNPLNVERLLAGPLLGYAGPTRAMIMCHCATFFSRVLGLDGLNLYRASKRILADEPPTDRSAMLREFERYRQAALGLDPRMEPGEEHLLDTAIVSRRAATAVIAVEIVPRATELTGLYAEDVVIDGPRVLIVIPARLSKTRVMQTRELTPAGGKVVIEYVQRAREYLVALRTRETDRGGSLWLTTDGMPLCEVGVLGALRLDLAKRLGVPVSCNILRRAMASRMDINESEAGEFLGHTDRSKLANDLYAQWDYVAALNDMRDVWDEYDSIDIGGVSGTDRLRWHSKTL